MPTKLPNGINIYNSTAHELFFFCGNAFGVITVEPDQLINAKPVTVVIEENTVYSVQYTKYVGVEPYFTLIKEIKEEYPGVIIIGSNIAARAYAGELHCSIPLRGTVGLSPHQKIHRSDRFAIYPKGD